MKRNSYQYPAFVGGLLVIIALSIWLSPVIAQTKKIRQDRSASKAEKIIVIDENGRRTTYYTDNLPSSVKKTVESAIGSGSRELERVPGVADALLKDMDLNGLTREVTRTLSEVRVSDLAAVADRALEEIDWEGVNLEVDRTLNELHRELSDPKLKRSIRNRLREAQEELSVVANDASIDIATAREELKAARKELYSIKSDREASKKDVPDASDTSYDSMLSQMERDSLINKAEGFDISKSGADLYINGHAQGDDVYNKYRRYLMDKNVAITGNDKGVTIELKK